MGFRQNKLLQNRKHFLLILSYNWNVFRNWDSDLDGTFQRKLNLFS
jgi:hypothetical protein